MGLLRDNPELSRADITRIDTYFFDSVPLQQ